MACSSCSRRVNAPILGVCSSGSCGTCISGSCAACGFCTTLFGCGPNNCRPSNCPGFCRNCNIGCR